MKTFVALILCTTAFADIEETYKSCRADHTCLKNTDCLSFQEKILSLRSLRSLRRTKPEYDILLRELKETICNRKERAVCCPNSPTILPVREPQVDVYCEDDLKTLFDDLSTSNTSLRIKCCHDGNKKTCVGHDCYDVCSKHGIEKIRCVELVSEYELENKDCSKNLDSLAAVICNTAKCPTKWKDPKCICCKNNIYNANNACGQQCKCEATCDWAADFGYCHQSFSTCCTCPNNKYKNACPDTCPPFTVIPPTGMTDSTDSPACLYKDCSSCVDVKVTDPCAKWCKCNCLCKYIVDTYTGCYDDWSECCDCASDTGGDYNTNCKNTCDILLDVVTTTPTPETNTKK